MVKFAFVKNYELFKECDLSVAEEALGEYNDFLIYNTEEYRKIFKTVRAEDDSDEINDDEIKKAEDLAEKNAEHFRKLFFNRDFAESSLVGMRIDYYALQRLLMREFRDKVPADKSVMNEIIPVLRDIASTLVIATRVILALDKHEDGANVIEKAKANFEKTLDVLGKCFALNMPEYTKYKERIATFKTAEGFLKMSEKVLETALSAIKFYSGKTSRLFELEIESSIQEKSASKSKK